MKRGKVRLNLPRSPKIAGSTGSQSLMKPGSLSFNNPRISPPGRGRPSGPGPARMLAPTPSRTDVVDSDLAINNRCMEDVTFRFRNPAGPDLRPTIKYEEIMVRGDLRDNERLARRDVQAPASHSLITDEEPQAILPYLRATVPQTSQIAEPLPSANVSIEAILSAAHRRDSLLFGGNAGVQATPVVEQVVRAAPTPVRQDPVAAPVVVAPSPPEQYDLSPEAPRARSNGRKVRLNMPQNPTITHISEEEERAPPINQSSRLTTYTSHSVAQPEEEDEVPPEVTASIQRMRRERGELPAQIEVAMPTISTPQEPVAPFRRAPGASAREHSGSVDMVADESVATFHPASTRLTPHLQQARAAQPIVSENSSDSGHSTTSHRPIARPQPAAAQPQYREDLDSQVTVAPKARSQPRGTAQIAQPHYREDDQLTTPSQSRMPAPLHPIPRLRERVALPTIEDNLTPAHQLQRLSTPLVQLHAKVHSSVDSNDTEAQARHGRRPTRPSRNAAAQPSFTDPATTYEAVIEADANTRTRRISTRNHSEIEVPVADLNNTTSREVFHSHRLPLLQNSLQREIGSILDEALHDVGQPTLKREPALVSQLHSHITVATAETAPSFAATTRSRIVREPIQHAASMSFTTPITTPTITPIRAIPSVPPPTQMAQPEFNEDSDDEDDPIALLRRRSKSAPKGRAAQPNFTTDNDHQQTQVPRMATRDPIRQQADYHIPTTATIAQPYDTRLRSVLRVDGASGDTNLSIDDNSSNNKIRGGSLRSGITTTHQVADYTMISTPSPQASLLSQPPHRVSRLTTKHRQNGDYALSATEEQPPTPTVFRVLARDQLTMRSGEQHGQPTPQEIDDERRRYVMTLPTPTRQAPRASLSAGTEEEGERRNQRVVLNSGRVRPVK